MTSALKNLVAAAALLALSPAEEAAAQNQSEAKPVPAAAGFCNADRAPWRGKVLVPYIKTSPAQDEQITIPAMQNLAWELKERTSMERPSRTLSIGIIGLDPETDDLCHADFLYWPITADTRPLSPQAQLKVEDYLKRGKFILFDIRDAGIEWRVALSTLFGRVNTGTLESLPEGHLLRNLFYKNVTLSGSLNFSDVQVQVPLQDRGDPISQIVVGERNWGGVLAGITAAKGSPAYEDVMRGIINAVFYAVTGNYKSDQPGREIEKIRKGSLRPAP